MAALLAALIITGAGWMPSYGANNDSGTGNRFETTSENNIVNGDNNTIVGDNNYVQGDNNNLVQNTTDGTSNNVIIGDSSYFLESSGNVYVGNGSGSGTNQNMSYVQGSAAFGDNIYIHGGPTPESGNTEVPTTDTLVIGNNVTLDSTDKSLILGDNNHVGKANNTLVIGDGVEIVSGKDSSERLDSTTVIGNDVHIGSFKEGGGQDGLSQADNVTVIGDHVNVDNTSTNTNSSNSLIYGNDVTMTNSQNSVAMGNDISMIGSNDKGDNVAIGSHIEVGVSLGEGASLIATSTVAMGDTVKVSGDNNIVIGQNIDLDQREDVIVLGHGAHTSGDQSISIGEQSDSGDYGTAVGGESAALGNKSGAFGFHAWTDQDAWEATAVGPYSVVNSSYSAAFGDSASIGEGSAGSVAIGSHSSVGEQAKYSIAIGGSGVGHDADVDKKTSIGDGAIGSIAMGYGATVIEESRDSIAIGTDAKVSWAQNGTTAGGIAIGNESEVSGQMGIALGYKSSAQGSSSIASGNGASAAGSSSIAIGDGAQTTKSGTNGQGSIAVGMNASVATQNGIALGTSSTVSNGTYGAMAIGQNSSVGENATAAVSIGKNSKVGAESDYSVALGDGSSVGDNASYAIALGNGASISNEGSWSMAMGYQAEISNGAQAATAMGAYKTSASAVYSTALGSMANVSTAYSVAAGYNSTAAESDIFTEDKLEAFKAQLGAEYTDLYNIKAADISEAGVFSVGSAGGERRIINVARGRISADSTDAVNGSQLYGAVKYLEGKIDEAGGGDVAIDGDDNITVNSSAPAADPGTGEGGVTVPGGETGGSTTEPGGSTGGETGGETGGTGGTTGGAGSGSDTKNFTVNMSDNPVFGGHEKDEFGHSPDGSVIVTGSSGANRVAINENNEGGMVVTSGGETVNINKGGDGLVNGLKNTEWSWSKYEEGGYEGSTNAATESQLHELVGGIEQDITTMGDQITTMGDQITNIGNHVDELDGRINEVGAGAAALAALHPLDFDPDEKWDFAAGYGHYRGEDAVAVGAFYRPNEDTMFSIGGTVGNGDEMINAGVSFKIGQGNHVSVSRVAMAKEIIELRKDLEDLRSAMASGVTGDTLDLSKIQLFPDTPENHWAYDYVATLAGNGILEGYPDGYFNGDRPITRYEMAAVLYRAMQKGVRLSEQALREFAPELDRIRVDTITKDDQGMPEIQRVRVVKGRE